MSKREKMILLASSFFVLLTFSDRLMIGPIINTYKSLDQQTLDLQMNIKHSMHLLAQKERIKQQAEKLASFSVKEKSPEEETGALLKLVEDLANQSSVNLLYIKPANAKTTEVGKKYYVTLECEAKMEQLITFFHKIEDSSHLLRIEHYEIQPLEKGSSVAKTAVKISKTFVP